MAYWKYHKEIKLLNPRGDILRCNVFTCKPHKQRIVDGWKKQYGKKFEELIIIESITIKA